MAFNLFDKVYVEPDFLYDNGYNRVIFSEWRNQAEYTKYDVLESPGFDTEVLLTSASVNDVVSDDQFESIAHYLKSLYDSNWSGRIYADQASYMPLFFTWLKISFPNIDDDSAFVLYNIIKQREELVFPDNRDSIGYLIPRINARDTNVILNKADFLTAMSEFNSADTVSPEYYSEVRDEIKDDLSIEIQLASYLSGAVDISRVSDKIKRITTKIAYNIVSDLKDYLRENIMTERVRAMTGITLSWEDQDWESVLRSKSPEMDFLFSSNEEAIRQSYDYRVANMNTIWYWHQWLVDNTTDEDKDDIELYDIVKAAEYSLQWKDCVSDDVATRHSITEAMIAADVAFAGSTIFFQMEYLRDKINTFWIEYVYQKSANGDTTPLEKISHT